MLWRMKRSMTVGLRIPIFSTCVAKHIFCIQALMMSGHYRHAKQLKRAGCAKKFIHIRLGRIRDTQRRLRDQEELAPLFADALRRSS